MAIFNNEEEKKKMEERLTEQTGNEVKIVEPTDTFDFKCQRCGQCCMRRNDIVLNPFDIYNACVALKIKPEEFLEKYTNITMGHNSKLPVITLKTDHRNWCHFLEFDIKNGGLFKCTINDNKPGACRNHPIGVVTSFKKDENDETSEEMHEMYIKVEQCEVSKGHNNPVLVADWMQKSEEYTEERKWSHKIQSLPTLKIDLAKFYAVLSHTAIGPQNMNDWSEEEQVRIKEIMDHSVGIMKFFFTAIMEVTYGAYDIEKPFLEQVKENYNKLNELCDAIGGHFKAMEETYDKATEHAMNASEEE